MSDNDKQRFSLIHISAAPTPKSAEGTATTPIPADDAATTSSSSEIPQSNQPDASDNPSDYLIRANQGHSLAIASESLLSPVTDDDVPSVVVHGTTHSAWPLIVATGGLKKMGRTHVHFASGLPAGFKSVNETDQGGAAGEASDKAAPTVISGMRKTSSVLVFLDIRKAMQGGLKFWLSDNGVILCEGDENGVIDLQYFSKVEDRTGGLGVLVKDGEVVQEAPAAWSTKGDGKRGGRGGGGGGGGRGGRGQDKSKPSLNMKDDDVALDG